MRITCLNMMASILLGFMLVSCPLGLLPEWQGWRSKAGSQDPNQVVCMSVMRMLWSCSSTTAVTESNKLKLSHSYLCTGKTLYCFIYLCPDVNLSEVKIKPNKSCIFPMHYNAPSVQPDHKNTSSSHLTS